MRNKVYPLLSAHTFLKRYVINKSHREISEIYVDILKLCFHKFNLNFGRLFYNFFTDQPWMWARDFMRTKIYFSKGL